MTEYLTRRAAREAETHRRRRRGDAPPQARAPRTRTSRLGAAKPPRADASSRHRGSSRSKGRIAAAGTASLLLVGSAMVAMPATAATVNPQPLYATQLLSNSQALTVSAKVQAEELDLNPVNASTFTGPTGAPALTIGGVTNADWAALVLQDASLPVTSNNITVILQWMDSENSPQSWWLRNNPLNNGLGSGGGSGFGSYPDLPTAAQYVAEQLGRSLFSGIAAALAADSAPSVTEQAIIASPWATSHYGDGADFHAVDVPIVAAPASAW